MKRADNIIELFQNLNPIDFLTPEKKEFYVNLYQQEIEEIKVELLHGTQSNTTIYVSGQTGSGKTTALNFLPDDEINKHFVIEYFYANELLELDDIDIVDILLILCYELVGDSERLKLKLGKRIIEMGQQFRGELEKTIETSQSHETGTGADIRLGVSKFLNFFSAGVHADYRFNYEKRNVARQVLKPKLEDLLSLTNEIIDEYLSEKDPNNQKKLLIFLHDLNHMLNPESIRNLFIKNRYYLERLKAVKIVTIPVGLRALPMFQAEISFLGLKTKPNPMTSNSDDENQLIIHNKSLLKSIVEKRVTEGANLIDTDALNKAIDYSGGIVRQLIDILHHAARKAIANNSEQIYEHHVDDGMTGVRRKLTRSMIKKERIEMLDFIRRHHSSDTNNEDLFIEGTASNQIIVYKNQDLWYDVNPLIEDTVKSYATKLDEDND